MLVSGIGLYYAYEKKPKFSDYYTKRLINVYFISIVIYFVFGGTISLVTKNSTIGEFCLNAFSLKWILGIDNTNWYVSFIMIMYIVFPLFYKFIKLIENSKFSEIIVAVIVAVYMGILILLKDTSFYNTYEIGLTRVPIFFVGCYAGYLVKNKRNFGMMFYLLAVLGVVLKVLTLKYDAKIFDRLSSFSFVFSVILVCVILLSIFPKFIKRFFVFCGKMSLELYLIHGVFNRIFRFDYIEYCNEITYIITVIAAFPFSFFVSKLREFINKQYVKRISK